jgi:hypothetical protein
LLHNPRVRRHINGIDNSCICRSIKQIEPILAKVIALKKDRTSTQQDSETIVIDCMEQPIERPKKRQKRYYSGKKKQHTLKVEIQMTGGGRIVSTAYSGAKLPTFIKRRSRQS